MRRREFMQAHVDQERLERPAPVHVGDVATDAQTSDHGARVGNVLEELAAATVLRRPASTGVLMMCMCTDLPRQHTTDGTPRVGLGVYWCRIGPLRFLKSSKVRLYYSVI